MKAMASARQSCAVASAVPVQSNSSWKRLLSVRGLLAPWLTTRGRTVSCSAGATQRKAAPLGAQSHLWQLPV